MIKQSINQLYYKNNTLSDKTQNKKIENPFIVKINQMRRLRNFTSNSDVI